MNSPLEYNGQPATFCLKTGIALNFRGEPLLDGDEVLVVCAWHDADKTLTKRLKADGYQVSHGICRDCLAENMNELERLETEQREETTMTDEEHAEYTLARTRQIRNGL